MKRCPRCGQDKPLEAFGIRRASKDGLQHACRECANRRQVEYRRANPERVRTWARTRNRNREAERLYAQKRHPNRRLAKYGLTSDSYATLLDGQGGACGVCGTTEPGGKHGQWHIDHDHACCDRKGSCGECVRGLLCWRCNAALGFIQDSPEVALALARYLNPERTGK